MTGQYEGKAKIVKPISKNRVEMFFKDDATAFNGKKHEVFSGKGELNSRITEKIFRYLEASDEGIHTHFIERKKSLILRQEDKRTLICKKADMFLVEAVVRYKAAGSLAKRLGVEPGTSFAYPIVEFYYKDDDLGDPLINEDHIVSVLKLATPADVTFMERESKVIASHLKYLMDKIEIDLVDMKFEFGKDHLGNIILADEITPDTCRMHDKETGKIFDKDVFREDMGDLLEGYREILKRLNNYLKE